MFRGGFSGDRGGYERGRGGRGRGRGGMDGGERLTQIQIQIKNKYKLRNYAWYGHSLINIWKHRNNDDKHNHSLIRFLNFLSSNSRRGSGNLTIQSCNVFCCWSIKLWGSWFPLFQLNWYLYSIDQRQSLYGDQRDKVEGRLDHFCLTKTRKDGGNLFRMKYWQIQIPPQQDFFTYCSLPRTFFKMTSRFQNITKIWMSKV